jgi:hypothetical protein
VSRLPPSSTFAGVSEFQINWWEVSWPSSLFVSRWKAFEQSSYDFQSNSTVKIIFEAINNQRVKVTIAYTDLITKRPVSVTANSAATIARALHCQRLCATCTPHTLWRPGGPPLGRTHCWALVSAVLPGVAAWLASP